MEDKRTIELNPNATHMGMLHEREANCALKRGLTNEWFDELMRARADYGIPAAEIAEFRKIYASSSRPGVLRKDLKTPSTGGTRITGTGKRWISRIRTPSWAIWIMHING